MDQNQWNALNQMLSRQSKTAVNTVKTGVSSGRQSGTVQTRVISAGNLSQQRSTKQLNGAQQNVMETGGSGVVKSLLTGRQYAQSVLRPDVGRGQNKPAAAKNPGGKQQVSVLQPNWQQSQQNVDAQAGAETQQLVLTGLPENIGPGESLYVVVDGVTYQIDSSNAELLAAATGNSTPASGASVVPIGSRMSLEDLANISAEQQNLSLDYQAAGGEMTASSGDVKLEMQSADASDGSAAAAQELDGQQFLETQATGQAASTATGNGSEPMQIIILPADGTDVKGADFKVGGQDFVLQPGQQLPRDLQEMVARGLPIDFSNYEFVIQEDDGSAAQDGSGNTYLSAGQVLSGSGDATGVMVSLAGSAVAGGSGDDILGMLADASSQQSHGIKLDFQQWAGVTPAIPVVEEDDGEFAYVTGNPDDGSGEPAAHIVHRVVTESGFLSAFTDFLSGAKSETLSSVANSTVIRRTPQLPIAYVPESKRKAGAAYDSKSKSPMTIVVTEGNSQKVMYVTEGGTPMSGRGRGRGRGRPPGGVVTQRYAGRSGEGGATKEQIRQSIISKRKHKGSDSDSYDEDDGAEGSFQIAAEHGEITEKDLIAASKLSTPQEFTRGGHVYKGRGRPRGSTLANRQIVRGMNMPTVSTPASSSSSTEHIAVTVEKEQQQGQDAFHLNPTEPHSYQKGDFVIERKDVWKTEGFPIWRIETGKLLQKFDSVPIDGGIIHKSASVYSSWSGDIRTSFKAVLVDLISSSAGRKQETVKVQEKFLVKPAEDSLDEDPLMATFAVFMHTMLSAALDTSFLSSIVQNEEDEYYMSSVRQVDTLLTAATQSILLQITWSEAFKLSADALPYYTMSSLPAASEQTYQCQACEDGITPAARSVKFYGVVYDRDILAATGEVEKASAQEFLIGKPAAEILISYHALQHFKFLIHQKCQEEVAYLRQTRKANDVEILTECLQNRIFLQHYFRELQSLLQQFIIVEHAVDPAVDPSAAAGPDQQQAIDEAALATMKQESQAMVADESAAQTDAQADTVVMAMMDTSAEHPSMETSSSADNQMAFEQDEQEQQPPAEPFVAEETGPSDIA